MSIRKGRFDIAFLIHRSFTRALLCWYAGIPKRIGFYRPKNSLVLTDSITAPAKNIHRQDYYFSLFEQSGIPITDKAFHLYIPAQVKTQTQDQIASMRSNSDCLIAVHVGANWKPKRWPPSYFAQLCDLCVRELKAAVIFTGTEKDKPLITEIRSLMHQPARDLSGQTSLKQLGALIESVDLFISNDSGPAHLSAALGIHTLVLFGPTSAKLTSQRGRNVKILESTIDCPIPCYDLECKDNRCMQSITPESVFTQAQSIIAVLKRIHGN